MKTLVLLRHAKADADSPSGDFERALNDRGRADARRMGEEIHALDLRFDLVLASPARRVVETAAEVGGLSPMFDRRLYNASADALLGMVLATDDNVDRLLLVGHNPGLEQLSAELTGKAIGDLPTTALVEIEFSGDRWHDAARGGRLVRFLRPADLA